ncbi:MAG: hypothetical protein IJ220_02365 [Clostridia bacterium]|nr:hypothetical protein [Clostridia bacterium]
MANIIKEMLEQKAFAQEEMKRLAKIRRRNSEELKSFFGLYPLSDEEQADLSALVDEIGERVFQIKAVLLEELPEKAGNEYSHGDMHARFQPGTFATMHVACSHLDELVINQRIQMEADAEETRKILEYEEIKKRQQEVNDERSTWLSMRLGGKNVPERFVRFQEEMRIPKMRTYFHGSREYVKALSKTRANPVVYGDMEGDIFAVSCENERFEKAVTFYIQEINYQAEFAARLVKEAGVSKTLAKKISEALPHDRWYAIMPPKHTKDDLLGYAREMAWRLHLKDGEVAHDLLQGDLVAFAYGKAKTKDGKEYSPTYLPIQDAPSAILVGNRINIYLPD